MTKCERFINGLLDSEKDSLLDYLFGYCDDPLESASEDLRTLFSEHDITDVQEIRGFLEHSYYSGFFNGGIPIEHDYSVWLNVSEIEVPVEDIPEVCLDEFTVTGSYGYYYVGYGLTTLFHEEIIIDDMCDLSRPVKGFYSVVYYHDVWRYDDQWQVNDLSRVRDNVHIDLDTMTDRELYCMFAEAAGLNKRLRAIEVAVSDESFIEFYYTANNDYYPLGRFELNVI